MKTSKLKITRKKLKNSLDIAVTVISNFQNLLITSQVTNLVPRALCLTKILNEDISRTKRAFSKI